MIETDFTLESSRNVDEVCKYLRERCVQFPFSYNDDTLRDKSIIITGGASGLGAAFTRSFWTAGSYVVFMDLNEDAGRRLEEELEDGGLHTRAQFISCDVTSWESQVQAFKAALSFFPSKAIDHVIPGAGISGNLFDMSTREDGLQDEPSKPDHRCIDISLTGTLYSVRLAAFYMGSRTSIDSTTSRTRSIVLVDSVAGYGAIPGAVDYTASKFGVRGLFKSMIDEFSALGIRLNMIAPGYIRTPLTANIADKLEAAGVKFATIETAVEAVKVLTCGSETNGRSICVSHEGLFDLRDDFEGLQGGEEFLNYIRRGNIPINPALWQDASVPPGTVRGIS